MSQTVWPTSSALCFSRPGLPYGWNCQAIPGMSDFFSFLNLFLFPQRKDRFNRIDLFKESGCLKTRVQSNCRCELQDLLA